MLTEYFYKTGLSRHLESLLCRELIESSVLSHFHLYFICLLLEFLIKVLLLNERCSFLVTLVDLALLWRLTHVEVLKQLWNVFPIWIFRQAFVLLIGHMVLLKILKLKRLGVSKFQSQDKKSPDEKPKLKELPKLQLASVVFGIWSVSTASSSWFYAKINFYMNETCIFSTFDLFFIQHWFILSRFILATERLKLKLAVSGKRNI